MSANTGSKEVANLNTNEHTPYVLAFWLAGQDVLHVVLSNT